jgi:hypothetical protein
MNDADMRTDAIETLCSELSCLEVNPGYGT